MNTRTRITAAVTLALTTVFFAAPAFASGDEGDTESMFSSAGTPVDIVAVSIVGVILLGMVVVGSTLIGNLFQKK